MSERLPIRHVSCDQSISVRIIHKDNCGRFPKIPNILSRVVDKVSIFWYFYCLKIVILYQRSSLWLFCASKFFLVSTELLFGFVFVRYFVVLLTPIWIQLILRRYSCHKLFMVSEKCFDKTKPRFLFILFVCFDTAPLVDIYFFRDFNS